MEKNDTTRITRRSYISVIRTESRQSIRSQNNQDTQEKMASPNLKQLVVGAIQELQYVMKAYMEKRGAI